MTVVCSVCQTVVAEKSPFEEQTISHSYCLEHLNELRRKVGMRELKPEEFSHYRSNDEQGNGSDR